MLEQETQAHLFLMVEKIFWRLL